MRYLSVAEVLALHDYQIQRFGGKQGVLNIALLESAVSRPKTNISGEDMYLTVLEKAAVLMFSLIKNHAFVAGNKRTGLHAAITFLEINNIVVKIKPQKLTKLTIDVANNKSTITDMAKFFENSFGNGN
jgi:death on curing protein